MPFNSWIYLVCFTVFSAAYYLIPVRCRILWLLLGSLGFAGWVTPSSVIALLLFSTLNFGIGRQIGHSEKNKKRWLYVGLGINVLALIFFKYLESNALGTTFAVTTIHFEVQHLALALGFSFYTLQNISYLVEVYQQKIRPVQSWLHYTAYTAFFPRLVAGPITLAQSFLPQLNNIARHSKQEDLIAGSQRILLGLIKKMVVADRLAPIVTAVFDSPDQPSGLTTLVASYLFTLQLYFDFSGYIDMALGSARILGFRLKENFNYPLRATSVSDFWRKWHISLIDWFTHYIYYPLVFRLRSYKKKGALVGITTIFLISGAWHGIGLTFFLWSVCHAIYLSVELLTKKRRLRWSKRLPNGLYQAVSIFITFNLVCFAHIFFRSKFIEQAWLMIDSLFSPFHFFPTYWLGDFIAPLAGGGDLEAQFNFTVSLFVLFLFLIVERKINRLGMSEQWQWGFWTIGILALFLLGIFDSGAQFIYLQF